MKIPCISKDKFKFEARRIFDQRLWPNHWTKFDEILRLYRV